MAKKIVFYEKPKDLWCPCCGVRLFDNGKRLNEETHDMIISKDCISFRCDRLKLVEITVKIQDIRV